VYKAKLGCELWHLESEY